MMPNNPRDLGVVVYFGQNLLTDRSVLLHLASFLERKSAGLLESPGGESDFSDVMNEAAHMNECLFFFRQPHPNGYVSGVDGHGGRVARRVSIACVQCRN